METVGDIDPGRDQCSQAGLYLSGVGGGGVDRWEGVIKFYFVTCFFFKCVSASDILFHWKRRTS